MNGTTALLIVGGFLLAWFAIPCGILDTITKWSLNCFLPVVLLLLGFVTIQSFWKGVLVVIVYYYSSMILLLLSFPISLLLLPIYHVINNQTDKHFGPGNRFTFRSDAICTLVISMFFTAVTYLALVFIAKMITGFPVNAHVEICLLVLAMTFCERLTEKLRKGGPENCKVTLAVLWKFNPKQTGIW